jgi:hypothetical protein
MFGRATIRVPHPLQLHRKGWGIVRSTTALFLLASSPMIAAGQESPCGISKIQERTAPLYPPIAKAAHVSGDVILIVRFAKDGGVSDQRILSGPEMLRKSATAAVATWKVNPYTGTRECPMVVSYFIESQERSCDVLIRTHPSDMQHTAVCALLGIVLTDPGGTITRGKHFLLF